MGYVGVTKGGGEEVRREKSTKSRQAAVCDSIQSKKIDVSHTPAQGTIVSHFHGTPLIQIWLFGLLFSLSFRLAGED